VTVKPSGGTAGYTVSVGGLPADLTFDAGSGAVTGVPTARGTFPLAIKVTDAHGLTSSSTVNLTVVGHLAIATTRLPPAAAGARYSAALRLAGGARPFVWSARGLPRGLRVQARTGVLAGVPAGAGTYRVRLNVRDALGVTSARTLTLVVH
jgi:hypothetical protein